MGKKPRPMEPIDNERKRQIAFYKRKKGLCKKVMELSYICKVKVFLTVIDTKNRVELFSSHLPENNMHIQNYLQGKLNPKKIELLDVHYIKLLILVFYFS